MARSRNIKPGFFTNDELGELPPLARLLWVGLWTLCDREGRCEDRPKKIKAEVLPYDECDADALLALLAERGFIERYSVDNLRCIQVVNWSKHQNPHMKEAPSTIPAPCKHQTSTVQEPDEQSPSTERAGLIPDSGFLIPDSLSLDCPVPVQAPAAVAAKRSKRVPADFIVTDDLKAWAAEKVPGVDLEAETENMRDHEYRDAHSDWPAAWRKWMRTAFKSLPKQRSGAPPNRQTAIEERNRAAGEEWLRQEGFVQ